MERRDYAERAARAFAAMQAQFWTRKGLYRRDGRFHRPGTAAHLWPFSRALVATLDLAGIRGDPPDFDAERAIGDDLAALERYWDTTLDPPAYSSDIRGARIGGDRYYDDNAWVGLALIQLERLRPGSGVLGRADGLFRFAITGWDTTDAGGVFWVEQGRGIGAKNHDRNTVSNAPNAELGFHLSELNGEAANEQARAMYEWVLSTLDESRDTDRAGTGLFRDKVQTDGTIDKTLWTYNQGSMIGANVLLARLELRRELPSSSTEPRRSPARPWPVSRKTNTEDSRRRSTRSSSATCCCFTR
jgi:hypothetical protein